MGSVKKKILFYKLNLTKKEQLNLFDSTETTLPDRVEKLSLNHDENETRQVIDEKIFQLYSFDRQHIFGTFGKVEDFKFGDYLRGRNREDYTIEDLSQLIELYTFFYLDLNTNHVVVIQNSNLPDFKNPFASFISLHFRISTVYDVKVVPFLDKNIERINKKVVTLRKIKCEYADNRLPNNEFLNIKETMNLATNEIEKAHVSLTMKQGTQKEFSMLGFDKDAYSEFNVETSDEIIDLVNGAITRKLTIEIDSEKLKNIEYIRELLRINLSNML